MATKRLHRDLRYRDKCFPGAAAEVFNPKNAGFAPLPYLSRELLRHLKDSELRVWVYMLTRAGEYSICYPTYEDLLAGTGVSSKGTISKAMHGLEKIGLILSGCATTATPGAICRAIRAWPWRNCLSSAASARMSWRMPTICRRRSATLWRSPAAPDSGGKGYSGRRRPGCPWSRDGRQLTTGPWRWRRVEYRSSIS